MKASFISERNNKGELFFYKRQLFKGCKHDDDLLQQALPFNYYLLMVIPLTFLSTIVDIFIYT